MKEILQALLQLQTIEFSDADYDEANADALRSKIPAPVLGHYDRLVERGKKGIVAVSHQTCTGCHMNVPLGTVMTLKRGDDIQMCENCGRYLYLPDEPVVPEKPKRRRAPRKSALLIPV